MNVDKVVVGVDEDVVGPHVRILDVSDVVYAVVWTDVVHNF